MYALYWIVCTPVYVWYNVERDVTVTVVWLPAGDVYGYYPLGLFLDTTDARQASTSANGQDNLCYCPDNPGGYFVGFSVRIVRSSGRFRTGSPPYNSLLSFTPPSLLKIHYRSPPARGISTLHSLLV